MPGEDLSDEDLAAEVERRRAKGKRKFRVWEVDEETFREHFGSPDDDEGGGTKKAAATKKAADKKGYFD